MGKLKVLIYCGNGYCFNEIYLPLIDLNYKSWDVDLLINDYYISNITRIKLNQLVDDKKIKSYKIIQSLHSINSYSKVKDIKESLSNLFDIFILGSDSGVIDRVLIDYVKMNKKCNVIIVQTGLLWRVHQCLNSSYYVSNKNNVVSFDTKNIVNYYDILLAVLGKLVAKKHTIKIVFLNFIRAKFNSLIYHYIYPLLFFRKIYRKNIYDVYGFSSSRSDATIVFDKSSVKALKQCVPILKNIHISAHPLSYCQKPPYELIKINKGILLVNFSHNLNDELEDDKINKWTIAIERISELASINDIHIRCHPRTSVNVQWPKKIVNILEKEKFNVVLIDSISTDLTGSILKYNYSGIIGSPSTSLIVSSTVSSNKTFVTCIFDSSSRSPEEKPWIIGSIEGINFADLNQKIEDEHLLSLKHKNNSIPFISDVIKLIVSNENIK
ncbi:hypothetical protein HN615_02465 [Candidatus Woesearchaeota archaeon]|nr:hypothetical protein [Candidatus Woesearchaeota archaeon]